MPERNLLISEYIKEVYVLSDAIVNLIENVEAIVSEKKLGMEGVINIPNNDKFFYIEPRIFTMVSSILVHSANIKKILIATDKKRGEAKYKYDYRLIRTKQLAEHFSVNNLDEIKKSDTRNSLEHYEERLDNISLRLWKRSIPKKYDVIANNMVLSSEGALPGRPFYLKCYVIDTKTYKNHETEADLGRIYAEVKQLKSEATIALGDTHPFSGSAIPIPPRD